MKDKDNAVIFHKDWLLLIDSLSSENKLAFWDLFTSYEYGKEQQCENMFVAPTWNFVKKQLDNMRNKYQESVVERNQRNGSKGGRPKKETQENPTEKEKPKETEQNQENPLGLNETQKTPKDKDNEKDNNNINVNDILLEKESKEILENFDSEIPKEEITKPPEAQKEKSSAKKEKFKIPTMAEVQDYCNERKNGISAYSFVNFYQSKGWRVGNQPMKDWKAAVHTWEQKNKPHGHTTTAKTLTQATRR